MAVIEKSIRLVWLKGEKEVSALFDSGSTYSCIIPALAKKIGRPERLPKPKEFGTAEKGKKVRAEEVVRLDFYVNGSLLSDEFMLIPHLSEEAGYLERDGVKIYRYK
jgi:hypothetical protein